MIPEMIVAYKLIKRLATPFKEWPAYKVGIIDAQGRVLKKRSRLKTSEEAAAWTLFDVFSCNLKKLVTKSPGGSLLGGAAAAAYFLREDLDEDAPTNSSGSGQVAAISEPMKTAKKRRVAVVGILKRKPVGEACWIATLGRVLSEHDADLFQNQDRDNHYHPAVRFKGKEYHSERPDWHADIIQRIQAKHKLSDDQVDHHIERGTMEMGLKHKKTGKTIWQYG